MRSFDAGLDVHSAGTRPAPQVHPAAVVALQEIGIDISAARPKGVGQYLNQRFDFVITVCDDANEACPAFTGAVGQRVHMGFEDPARATGTEADVLDRFRTVRDQIRERLYQLYQVNLRD